MILTRIQKRCFVFLLATCVPALAQEPTHTSPDERFLLPITARRVGSPYCQKTATEVIQLGRGLCDPNHLPTVGVQTRFYLPSLDRPAGGLNSRTGADSRESAVMPGEALIDGRKRPDVLQGMFGNRSDLKNPLELKSDISYTIFMPDILLLYQMSLICDSDTTFSKTLGEFWSAGMGDEVASGKLGAPKVPSQMAAAFNFLYKQSGELSKLPGGLANAVADEISVNRLTTLSKRTECANAKLDGAESTQLKALVLAFHQRLKGKNIRTMADLYAVANSDEKALLQFLYGKGAGNSSPADFFLEWERANYFRNLLVNGEIQLKRDGSGFSLAPKVDGGRDVLASNIVPKEKLANARHRLEEIASQGRTGSPFFTANQEAVDPSLRPYYQEVLGRLETEGINAHPGETWKPIAVERLRSYLTEQLAAMDFAAPDDNELLIDILPEKKAALLLAAKKSEGLYKGKGELRAALSFPLTADHTAGLKDEDLLQGAQLHDLLKSDHFDFNRATQLQMFRPDVKDLLGRLDSAQSRFRTEIWSDYGTSTPHFYARQLAGERKEFSPAADTLFAPLIDRIALVLGTRGLGLSSQDRIALRKNLNLFSLNLLANMLEHTAKDDTEVQSRLNKEGFHANFAPFDELARIVYDPAGKDALVQTMALISRLNQADSDRGLRVLLQGELAHSSLKLPQGLSVGSETLTGAQSEQIAEAAEALLTSGAKLGTAEFDALSLLSQVMRARGHDSKTLYGEIPDAVKLAPVLNSTSTVDQLKMFALQKKMAGESGEIGARALDALKTAKESHLPGMGLPAAAEAGIFSYLARSPDIGPELLRQLKANLSPEKYAQVLATTPLNTGEEHLTEALQEVSPRMHHLLTNGRFQQNKLIADAIREISATGRLTESTQSMLPAMLGAYPQCAEAEDKDACLREILQNQAVLYQLELGNNHKADQLLEPHIPDVATRSNHLESLKAKVAQRQRIRKIAACSQPSIEELINDPTFMEYDDGMSGAEALRRRAVSRWEAINRDTLAETLSDSAVRLRIDLQNKGSMVREKARVEEYRAARKASYPYLSDAQLAEFVQKKAELAKLRPQLEAQWAKVPRGRGVRMPPEVQGLTAKISEYTRRIAELKKKSGFYDVMEAKQFSDALELKLAEAEAAVAAGEISERLTSNSPQEDAWALLKLAAMRSFPARTAEDGDSIPAETRVARLMDMAQANPEFAAKFDEAIGQLAIRGFLSDGQNAAVEDAATKALWDEVLKVTQMAKTKLSLQQQLDGVLKACAGEQGSCPLSPTELEYLRELYSKHGPGGSKDLLFNAQHTLAQHDGMQAAEEALELQEFRKHMVLLARGTEPAVKSRQLVDTLRDSIGANCPDTDKPQSDGEAMAAVRNQYLLRQDLLWGRSIADALAKNLAAEATPDFENLARSPAARQRWLKKVGGWEMAKDWVFQMSSGVGTHKMTQVQAWKAFMQLMAKATKEATSNRNRKLQIESDLREIGMTPSGSSEGDLWNWDEAQLHKVAPNESKKKGQRFTRSEFLGRLNEYLGLVSAETQALNSGYNTVGLGEDELHRRVHDAFLQSGYKRDAVALTPKTLVARHDSSIYPDQVDDLSGHKPSKYYEFKDYATIRPELEKKLDRVSRLTANNGELHLAMAKSEGFLEMSKRMGGETANDKSIESMFNEIATTLSHLNELGTAPIKFRGEEMPADEAAKKLAKDYGKVLQSHREILEGILKVYGIVTDEVLSTLMELAFTGAIMIVMGPAGPGIVLMRGAAKLMKFRKLVKLLNRYEKYGNMAIGALKSGKIWWLKKGVDLGKNSYKMAKLGATSSLWSAPFNAALGTHRLWNSGSQANAIDIDPQDGVPDWVAHQREGLNYHFPEDVRASIDMDDNGVPDSVDVGRGMPIAKYTVGSFTDMYESAKSSAMTMALTPVAGAGFKQVLLRPLAKAFTKAAPVLNSFEMAGGVFTVAMAKKHALKDSSKSVVENVRDNWNWEIFKRNALNSLVDGATGVAPFDDLAAAWILKRNANASPATIRLVKSIFNHGQDALQGVVQVARTGEYKTTNGITTTNPFYAALASMGEGAYMSQKASNSKNAVIDALPKIIADQVISRSKSGEVNIDSPLLDFVLMEGVDKKTKKPFKTTVRSKIAEEANLGDFRKADTAEAFMAIFTAKLVEDGVPPERVREFFAKALAKTPELEKRLGEVDPFLDYIVREKMTADLLEGRLKANEFTETKTSYGAYQNFHRKISAVDAVAAGGAGFKNPEVVKAVDRVAIDFGLNATAFKEYVLTRVKGEAGGMSDGYTLEVLAREMRNRTRY